VVPAEAPPHLTFNNPKVSWHHSVCRHCAAHAGKKPLAELGVLIVEDEPLLRRQLARSSSGRAPT
jgi:hypothetical protein